MRGRDSNVWYHKHQQFGSRFDAFTRHLPPRATPKWLEWEHIPPPSVSLSEALHITDNPMPSWQQQNR